MPLMSPIDGGGVRHLLHAVTLLFDNLRLPGASYKTDCNLLTATSSSCAVLTLYAGC
jgi:hypothetical protein